MAIPFYTLVRNILVFQLPHASDICYFSCFYYNNLIMSKLILQFLKRFYFYSELMCILERVCADESRCPLSRAEVKVTVST